MRVSRAILISGFAGVLACIGQSCVPTTQQPPAPPAGETPGNNGVVPAAQAPVIAAVPDHNAHAGQAYSLQCRLVNGSPTTWSVDLYMSMNGMLIDSTGRITWTTPTDVYDHNNFDITVTASNSAGVSEMKYRLTVYKGSNSPPTVIQPTARVETVTRTEANVTLSCDVYDAESDSQQVTAILTALGAAPVSLVRQGSAQLGYHYAWQGRMAVPIAIGTGMVWQIGESDGALYHYGDLTLAPAASAGLPTVQVSSDKITGPGGSLVYQGHQIAGTWTLQVPMNALMGVVKASGETYLYHPALGDAELTNFTSRQAVGAFISGLSQESVQAASAGAASRLGLSLAAAANGSSCTTTPLNTNVTTTTGAKVYATEGSTGVTSQINNPTKRWMAIKSQSGDGPYFLAPAARGEYATDVIGLLQQIAQGRQISSTEKTITGEPVEIYGSLARAIPFLLAPPDLPLDRLPESLRQIIEPYVPWGSYQGQSFLTTLEQLREKALPASSQDMSLYVRLTMIDLGHLFFEGLKSVLGAIPEECTEAIIKAITYNIGEPLWIGLFTFESDPFFDFLTASMKELGSNALLCGGELTTGPVGGVVANLLDILAGFAWIREWNLGRDDAMYYRAFECLRFQPDEPPPPPPPSGERLQYEGPVTGEGCSGTAQLYLLPFEPGSDTDRYRFVTPCGDIPTWEVEGYREWLGGRFDGTNIYGALQGLAYSEYFEGWYNISYLENGTTTNTKYYDFNLLRVD